MQSRIGTEQEKTKTQGRQGSPKMNCFSIIKQTNMLDNRIHLTQDYFSFVKKNIIFQRKLNDNSDLQFHVFAI